MSDIRIALAREEHRAASEARTLASQHVRKRDDLIRRVWSEDRVLWTYDRLAKAVGCSPELIAKVIQQR